jgi:hypothetical protein
MLQDLSALESRLIQPAETADKSRFRQRRSAPGALHNSFLSTVSRCEGPMSYTRPQSSSLSTIAAARVPARPTNTWTKKVRCDAFLAPPPQLASIVQQATAMRRAAETAPGSVEQPFASPPFKLLTPSGDQLKPACRDTLRLTCARRLMSHACSLGGSSVESDKGGESSAQAFEPASTKSLFLSTTVTSSSTPRRNVSSIDKSCNSSCTSQFDAGSTAREEDTVPPRDPIQIAGSSALFHSASRRLRTKLARLTQTDQQSAQQCLASRITSCRSADTETRSKRIATGTLDKVVSAPATAISHRISSVYSGSFTAAGELMLDAENELE